MDDHVTVTVKIDIMIREFKQSWSINSTNINKTNNLLYTVRGHRGRGLMVVGFTTTCAIRVYPH